MKKRNHVLVLRFAVNDARCQSSSPVPSGTAADGRLDTTLATFSNEAGDQFRGSITATDCH